MYRPINVCRILFALLFRAAAGTELTVDLSNDCNQELALRLHFHAPK